MPSSPLRNQEVRRILAFMAPKHAADIARSMAGTPYINRRLTKAIELQEAIDEIKYTHGGFLWAMQ